MQFIENKMVLCISEEFFSGQSTRLVSVQQSQTVRNTSRFFQRTFLRISDPKTISKLPETFKAIIFQYGKVENF